MNGLEDLTPKQVADAITLIVLWYNLYSSE